jgi:hypothetical protein
LEEIENSDVPEIKRVPPEVSGHRDTSKIGKAPSDIDSHTLRNILMDVIGVRDHAVINNMYLVLEQSTLVILPSTMCV